MCWQLKTSGYDVVHMGACPCNTGQAPSDGIEYLERYQKEFKIYSKLHREPMCRRGLQKEKRIRQRGKVVGAPIFKHNFLRHTHTHIPEVLGDKMN